MALRTHLVALRDTFRRAAELPEDVTVRPIAPSYPGFLARLALAGDGWHLRPEIAAPSPAFVRAIEDGELFVVERAGREVGFCYVTFEGDELRAFGGPSPVEINKIALYPGETGHGLGRAVVEHVMATAFAGGARAVYLNTRDSNRINSVKFYERIGFSMVAADRIGERPLMPA